MVRFHRDFFCRGENRVMKTSLFNPFAGKELKHTARIVRFGSNSKGGGGDSMATSNKTPRNHYFVAGNAILKKCGDQIIIIGATSKTTLFLHGGRKKYEM